MGLTETIRTKIIQTTVGPHGITDSVCYHLIYPEWHWPVRWGGDGSFRLGLVRIGMISKSAKTTGPLYYNGAKSQSTL
jgi:hypothetical protein